MSGKSCKHCGCTDDRACVLPPHWVSSKELATTCHWIDPQHTVCSNPVCMKKEHEARQAVGA